MHSSSLGRIRALVIDDSHYMRSLLKAILQALGIGMVVTVESVSEGLNELRIFAPDIVFVDWVMSPLDGIDFVKAVRTGPGIANPYLPIVMITGHTDLARIEIARDAGVTEFLTKPVSARSVYQRLHSIVESNRPFVKTATYFGPERRRQARDFPGIDLRSDPKKQKKDDVA